MRLNRQQISLYKKADTELLKRVGLKVGRTYLYYVTEGETIEINTDSDALDLDRFYQINELDSKWSPDVNELCLHQEISMDNPNLLFGKNGITMQGNIIGAAAHIYSRDSGFQKTVLFHKIKWDDKGDTFCFEYCFDAASLRGKVTIDFSFYLDDIKVPNPLQASVKGMNLCENGFFSVSLIVDGVGSVFPITEFAESKGPLWRLEKNWIDASEEYLDTASVSLALNTKHPLFPELSKDQRLIQRGLMGEIMTHAISMIIQEVVLIDKLSPDDEGIQEGTILDAVRYWIDTFEVDISSLTAIQNSLKENRDQWFMGGMKND